MRPEPPGADALTILVPVLNEGGTLARVLRSIPHHLAPRVLVVDGGSTDGSVAIAERLGFAVIRQDGVGLGRAMQTGVRRARGRIVATLDADGAHTGDHVVALLARLDEGYDLVVASRFSNAPDTVGMFSPHRRSTEPGSRIRSFGNRLFTCLCRVWFDVPIHDVLNGCKAFRRDMFLALPLEGGGHEHDLELVIKAQRAGFRIAEVPIRQSPRLAGASKLNAFRHGFVILRVLVTEALRGWRAHARGLHTTRAHTKYGSFFGGPRAYNADSRGTPAAPGSRRHST